MRKRISARKFGRSAAHRKALMSNLASSLIEHKRIKTTHEKALGPLTFRKIGSTELSNK